MIRLFVLSAFLAFASAVHAQPAKSVSELAGLACGHDIHMASWVGAATLLSGLKDRWHGTLVFVGQPAEETVSGANAMVKDGLFSRLPKPDFVLGLHDTNLIPAGRVGLVSGPASAASYHSRRRVRLDALRTRTAREGARARLARRRRPAAAAPTLGLDRIAKTAGLKRRYRMPPLPQS